MLPLTFLAKYALITSLISFTRFFPEAYNSLILLKHHQDQARQKRELGVLAYALFGIAVIAFVFVSQGFIQIVFGEKWLLPINVAMIFAVQELLRGWYQSNATKLVAIGGSREVSQISLFLIVGALVLMVIGINLIGLLGAPVSMAILYAVLNIAISRKLKVLN